MTKRKKMGQEEHTKTNTVQPTTENKIPRSLKETALHQNAFWLLGVTIRDDKSKIIALAEEKLLELDHDVCQKARTALTNPRTRLAAEIAWLPGVSPKKSWLLAKQVLRHPMSMRTETSLPVLARANLMAAAFEAIDEGDLVSDIAAFIQEMADVVDELAVDDVLRDVNEDRAVSGFPEVKTEEPVDSELAERKRYYRNVIKDALDRLPAATLVEVMTATVDSATGNGDYHAPELIDDLVDSYEVETQDFLQRESENVHKLLLALRECSKAGDKSVNLLIDNLVVVARNWDRVAQPIQLSAKARGIMHQPSRDLAFSIRSLAIDLFNEHDMVEQSRRIANLLKELFAEIPEVVERVEQDVDALADIINDRKNSETQREEWEKEIAYRVEIGIFFKDTLSISRDGVAWKGKSFPLDSITRVRWGGVRHSVNGIPTGTTYTLAFGDVRSEAVLELSSEGIYSTFIGKLWRAVCARLLAELLDTLKAGGVVSIGNATIRDDGPTLIKHKFLSSGEHVKCTWSQTHVWNADGSFYIGAKEDKKTYAELSYIYTPNVHILEQVIRMAFKKPGMRMLSDVLRGD